MTQATVQLGSGGRLVIPAEMRAALGVDVGDSMILVLHGEALEVMSTRAAIRRAQELVARHVPRSRSLADELIEERRRDADAS